MGSAAAAVVETPVLLSTNHVDLFGMWTAPSNGAGRGSAVLLAPGGWVTGSGRNRIYQRIARELAGRGYATLRFDYHGVGASCGSCQAYRLGDPAFRRDVDAAVAFAGGRSPGPVILVGSCFGAGLATLTAPRVEDLGGVILFSAPVCAAQVEPRAGPSATTTSREGALLESLSWLLEERPTTLAYGTDDGSWLAFLRAQAEGDLRHPGQDGVVTCLDGQLEGFPTLSAQDETVGVVASTLRRWDVG